MAITLASSADFLRHRAMGSRRGPNECRFRLTALASRPLLVRTKAWRSRLLASPPPRCHTLVPSEGQPRAPSNADLKVSPGLRVGALSNASQRKAAKAAGPVGATCASRQPGVRDHPRYSGKVRPPRGPQKFSPLSHKLRPDFGHFPSETEAGLGVLVVSRHGVDEEGLVRVPTSCFRWGMASV